MGSTCTSPFIGSGKSVDKRCRVNIVTASEWKICQCLLCLVRTGTSAIVLEHLLIVIGFVGRLRFLFHIGDM
jgi:hypothetical protein